MEFLFSALLWIFSVTGYETPHPGSVSPRITFRYDSRIDQYFCPVARSLRVPMNSIPVDVSFDRLRQDLTTELPRLQKLWDEQGPVLLKAASEMLHSKFSYEQDETLLFFCPSFPSWAKPRMISVWQYMPSVPAENRWQNVEFVDVVFHEHLHMLINRLLGWKLKSPILEKYKNEALFTKIHLHLYAVQKSVYLNLGMNREWQLIRGRNSTFPPQYRRSVEIVEQEGTQAFVDELR